MFTGETSKDNRLKPKRRASVTTISSLENQANLASLSPFDESASTSVSPFNDSINHSSQSNVKIDGSKAIHVGDIINKYYVTQMNQTINPDTKFSLPSSESSETVTQVDSKERFISVAWRFTKKRKYWILIGLAFLVIGLSIGITFAVLDKSNETTISPISSTTSGTTSDSSLFASTELTTLSTEVETTTIKPTTTSKYTSTIIYSTHPIASTQTGSG